MVLMLSIIGVIFSINHIMGVFAIKDALGTNKLDDNFCVFQGILRPFFWFLGLFFNLIFYFF